MNASKKPMPVVSPWAQPFWDGTREEKLMLQKCSDCAKFIFYPRIVCPHCFSDNLEWAQSSGKGTVYSYTVVENNAPSFFQDEMPFVVALIRLQEGVQMMSNIVSCEPSEVYCDMPVEVTFDKVSEEFTLPKFRPATGS
ncbi:MAG: Zn-ribbon domain-containing OB-fold protein [Desulfobacterales bacterium]|nr:Zn-ribbon domain-containing OB-fold protein [Desulfobacterales bacterium]